MPRDLVSDLTTECKFHTPFGTVIPCVHVQVNIIRYHGATACLGGTHTRTHTHTQHTYTHTQHTLS